MKRIFSRVFSRNRAVCRNRHRDVSLEVLEPRIALAGDGVPQNPLGAAAGVNLASDSNLDDHVLYNRQLFESNQFTADVAELEANRGQRVPDLDSLRLEHGPTAEAAEKHWSDSNSHAYSGQPGGYTPLMTEPASRKGKAPDAAYVPVGPMADDYDLAAGFMQVVAFEGELPPLHSKSFVDVALFLPDEYTNSSEQETFSETWTVEPHMGHEIAYSLQSTRTVDRTFDGVQWTYHEVLVTDVLITSSWLIDFSHAAYPGSTGQITRQLTQDGVYRRDFYAIGTTALSDATLLEELEDSFTDVYTETLTPDTPSFRSESHGYEYVAETLYPRVMDSELVLNVAGALQTHDERNHEGWVARFDSTVDSLMSSTELTSSELVSKSQTATLEEYLLVGTTRDDSELTTIDLSGSSPVSSGTKTESSVILTSYEASHNGSYTYADDVFQANPADVDRISLRTETWFEHADYIGISNSNNQVITVPDQSREETFSRYLDVQSRYLTEGEHELTAVRTTNGAVTTSSTYHEYSRDHGDMGEGADLLPLDATGWVRKTDSESSTAHYDSAGTETSRSGLVSELGTAFLSRRIDMHGDYQETRSGSLPGMSISAHDQKDEWQESVNDYFALTFRDDYDHAPDGTVTRDLEEQGEGLGTWVQDHDARLFAAASGPDWSSEWLEIRTDSQTWDELASVPNVHQLDPALVDSILFDPESNPTRQDQWGYWYGTSEVTTTDSAGVVLNHSAATETRAVDPNAEDADVIDGRSSSSSGPELPTNLGGRNEVRFTDLEVDWGGTQDNYYQDSESLTRIDETFETYNSSLAIELNSGTQTYEVWEHGFTTSHVDEDDYQYKEHEFNDGYNWQEDDTQRTTESEWHYEDHYFTEVDALGVTEQTGALHDWGESESSLAHVWAFQDHQSDPYMTITITGNGSGSVSNTLTYDYLTVISVEDVGGVPTLVASVTGQEVALQQFEFLEALHALLRMEFYPGHIEEFEYTDEIFGMDQSGGTTTNDLFVGPRSGRERIYGWCLEPIRFADA